MHRGSAAFSLCSRVICGLTLLLLTPAITSLKAQSSAATQPSLQPEIVRLSYVEGDVRITRGDDGRKLSGADWQKAVTGTPVEGGFSVVTGSDGRAEVEFEDTSVAYLAPDSVLIFDQLAALGDSSFSRMQLLSGTLTMRLRLIHPRELYSLVTPQDTLTWSYPHIAYVRVDSFLDTTVLTPLDEKGMQLKRSAGLVDAHDGFSLYLRAIQDSPKPSATTGDKLKNDPWDAWVSARLSSRDQAMTTMMHESGLGEPIPGLADLAGRGKFFDCAPYGKCWVPTGGWSPKPDSIPAPAKTAIPQTISRNAAYQLNRPHLVRTAFSPQMDLFPDDYDDGYFPCSPYDVRYPYGGYSAGNPLLIGSGILSLYPYDWSICHAGSWIQYNHRYAWVAGTHHHHHCPVHWVSNAGHKGYVPIHPRDVKGKSPLNLKYGLYETKGWKQGKVEHVAYNPDKGVKVMPAPPKEFASLPMPKLPAAETPRPTAREFLAKADPKETPQHTGPHEGSKAEPAGPARAVEIHFNRESQSFSLAHEEMHDGKMRTVSTPFAGASRGVGTTTMASRGNSGASGGGIRGGGGSSGGAFHGGGGGSSAGASHSGGGGGGASSGGGGAHK